MSASSGCGCLHVNDSKVPLGANRDRHANLGEGELASAGSRPSSPSRASRGCPPCSRPGADGGDSGLRDVEVAKRDYAGADAPPARRRMRTG